jgi:hypothetical protein
MESLRLELNERIEAVGTIEEIESLKLKADSDRQMARETLEAARKDAADLDAASALRREALEAELFAARELLARERAAFEQHRREETARLSELEKALQTQAAELREMRIRADADLRDSAEQKARYEAMEERLRAAIRS